MVILTINIPTDWCTPVGNPQLNWDYNKKFPIKMLQTQMTVK